MRILWSVFITFPEVASLIGRKAEYACTWARALSQCLRKEPNVELAIVSIHSGTELRKFEVDNVFFYFLPNEKLIKKNGGGFKTRKHWKDIIDDFNPDLIHIHGSESLVSYELLNLDLKIPVFLTLQGILSNYWKDEYAGLSLKDLFFNISIRDIVRGSGIILDRNKTKKRSLYERHILSKVKYVGGRTMWDRVSALNLNPNLIYLYSPEMMRHEFYDSERWNINKKIRYRIFMHQGFKPIKGLHMMLDAMYILKKRYPNVELYMSGTNVMNNQTIKDKLLQPGYVRYLFKKIKQYNLSDNIHFTGILDAGQIVEELKKSHIMVLPSSIENSPNSLVEAQLIGIPCVASYVGGVPDMIKAGDNGFLYTFNEPLMLAEYISILFDSDSLCEMFSVNSYNNIRSHQGINYVLNKTLENYNFIINDYKK